jgi:hypothetical protein
MEFYGHNGRGRVMEFNAPVREEESTWSSGILLNSGE